MNNKDVIGLARSFKKHWHTDDPYEICNKLGIEVVFRKSVLPDFTAQVLKREGLPAIISINDDYDDFSKRLLCAHELGHALLHDNMVNSFAVNRKNAQTNLELEANMFAIALIGSDDINRELSTPLEAMNNYLLKTIMDYNLKKR